MDDVSDHTDHVACCPSEPGGRYACGGEDEFNTGFTALKNHEMIHLRQAQACGDSWVRFYLLYLWYWLRALPANRKLRHGAYLLNPFEMEAYRHMNDLHYLADGEANEWRKFAKMSIKERITLYEQKTSGA